MKVPRTWPETEKKGVQKIYTVRSSADQKWLLRENVNLMVALFKEMKKTQVLLCNSKIFQQKSHKAGTLLPYVRFDNPRKIKVIY